MLKLDITYADFNDKSVSEPFYFNISEPELIEMEVEYVGGWGGMIMRAQEQNDMQTLLREFKKLLLVAYGEKSDDGKYFVKSDDLRTKFSQHAAYVKLFTDLATDADYAANFIVNVMPKSVAADFDKVKSELEATSGPKAPPVPTS